MTWYIDSWAVLDGVAFASERESEELDAERTVLLAVPELKPIPVAHVTTGLWASRGHFQLGLYDGNGNEVGFKTLAEVSELVRRGFLGGGDGGPPPGGPEDVGPLPNRPRNNVPSSDQGIETQFRWDQEWGSKPRNPATATEAIKTSLKFLDNSRAPDRFSCALGALDALTQTGRLQQLDELLIRTIQRKRCPKLIARDASAWLAMSYGAAPWRRHPDWTPIVEYLRQSLEGSDLRELDWWYDDVEFGRRIGYGSLARCMADGLLFRTPIPAPRGRPNSLGDLLAMASANTRFLDSLMPDEWGWLLLAAKAVVIALNQPQRSLLDEGDVLAEASGWLRSSLPRTNAVQAKAARALEEFLETRLESRVG